MSTVELKNIVKKYGDNTILNDISLNVNAGEFLVLVGPSGCGKSTMLRVVSGLESISSGSVIIDGKDVTKAEPQDRNLAMVFQSYALYPHMTVFENMAFSLKIKKMTDSEVKKRIDEVSDLLQMTPFLARKPKDLSGGQRQRVSLGRALVRRSPVILFDEPLSNLDAHLRNQMRIEIKKIHQLLKSTIIYVTHDQTEAMTMGDRIAVLNKGKIEQLGTPSEIYQNPKNLFVANFIGTPEMNFFESTDKLKTQGIRPENIKLTENGEHKARVLFYENLGPSGLLHVEYNNSPLRLFTENQSIPKVGDHVFLSIDQTKVLNFDKVTGEQIK
jgi:ABC-type sugar transport system ATPase subunit